MEIPPFQLFVAWRRGRGYCTEDMGVSLERQDRWKSRQKLVVEEFKVQEFKPKRLLRRAGEYTALFSFGLATI